MVLHLYALGAPLGQQEQGKSVAEPDAERGRAGQVHTCRVIETNACTVFGTSTCCVSEMQEACHGLDANRGRREEGGVCHFGFV